jgi:hypothetical protein
MRRTIGILSVFSAAALAACNLDVNQNQGVLTQAYLDITVTTPDGSAPGSRGIGVYAYRGDACSDPRFGGAAAASVATSAAGRLSAPVYVRGDVGTQNACVALYVLGGTVYRDTIVSGFLTTFRSPDSTKIDTVRATIALTQR